MPERRSPLVIFVLLFTPLMATGLGIALFLAGGKQGPKGRPLAVVRPAEPAAAPNTVLRGEGILLEGQSFAFIPGANGAVRLSGGLLTSRHIRAIGAVDLDSVTEVPRGAGFWELVDDLTPVRRYRGWATVRVGHSYALWFYLPGETYLVNPAYVVLQVVANEAYSGIRSVQFRFKVQTNGTNRF